MCSGVGLGDASRGVPVGGSPGGRINFDIQSLIDFSSSMIYYRVMKLHHRTYEACSVAVVLVLARAVEQCLYGPLLNWFILIPIAVVMGLVMGLVLSVLVSGCQSLWQLARSSL